MTPTQIAEATGATPETVEGSFAIAGALHLDRGGRYAFICSVPGHEQAGMHGTLVVT